MHLGDAADDATADFGIGHGDRWESAISHAAVDIDQEFTETRPSKFAFLASPAS